MHLGMTNGTLRGYGPRVDPEKMAPNKFYPSTPTGSSCAIHARSTPTLPVPTPRNRRSRPAGRVTTVTPDPVEGLRREATNVHLGIGRYVQSENGRSKQKWTLMSVYFFGVVCVLWVEEVFLNVYRILGVG